MLNKKIWLLLGLVAMGCAANTETAVDTNDETEESSDSLSSRRLVGTYVRLVESVDGCQVVSRLELDARGRFNAEFEYSAVPGRPSAFLCAAVLAAPLNGTWSATSRGRITLRSGHTVLASAVGNGGTVRFTSSSTSAVQFAGQLDRLAVGSCLDISDCSSDKECVLPPYSTPACDPTSVSCRPNPDSSGRLVGSCTAIPGPVDAGGPPDAGPPQPSDAGHADSGSGGGYPDAAPPTPVDGGSGGSACGPAGLICASGESCQSVVATCSPRATSCPETFYCAPSTPADAGSAGGSPYDWSGVPDPSAAAE